MIKWCAMHVIHLGCDLWLVGNALKTLLLDTTVFGDGCDDERLLNAWQWARQNKWQPLGFTNLSVMYHQLLFKFVRPMDSIGYS